MFPTETPSDNSALCWFENWNLPANHGSYPLEKQTQALQVNVICIRDTNNFLYKRTLTVTGTVLKTLVNPESHLNSKNNLEPLKEGKDQLEEKHIWILCIYHPNENSIQSWNQMASFFSLAQRRCRSPRGRLQHRRLTRVLSTGVPFC